MKTGPLMRGGASVLIILVIFIMLSLGALSMMSASADLKLARASAEWITRYYELEKEANVMLREINMTLSGSYNTESRDFSRDKLRTLKNDGWTIHEKDGKIFIHRDVSLGKDEIEQNLSIELQLSPPDESGRYYRIIQWKQWRDDFEYEQEGIDIWVMQWK